ncbi:MAG: PAS domain S-box protein [Desulfobacterales bacterium]
MPKADEPEKPAAGNRRRAADIYELAPVELCSIGVDGTILNANQACASLLECEREDLVGIAFQRFLDADCRDRFRRFISACRESGKRAFCELKLKKGDGSLIHARLASVAVKAGQTGRAVALIGITDISEHVDLLDRLARSEKNYRILVENANEAIVVAQDGYFRFVNPAAGRLFRYPADVLLSRPFIEFVHPEDRQKVAEHHRDRMAGEASPVPYEMRIIDSRGITRWIVNNGTVIDWEGKKAILIFFTDTTEGRVHRERIRKLSQRLLHAQEAERRMISSELHDRVAQNLSAAKMACDSVAGSPARVSAEAANVLREVSELIHNSITAARDLSYEMSPPGLAELGLAAAVSNFCHDFAEKTGIEVDFLAAGMKDIRLPLLVGISAYRSIQEAMNNVRKHARAGRISVRLVRAYPNLIARVEDDGVGFDVKEGMKISSAEKRMGLFSIQQRMRLLGGEVTIRSTKGAGTRLSIRLPLEE